MADAGYTRAEIAKALNVSKPMLCMWARRENMQELHDKVKDIRDPRAFNYEKVKSRLRDLIVAKENGMTRTEVARAWGVSPAAVTQWVKRNAPDGVEDAYSDYMED
jgi:predicted transcriptional regulator